MESNKKGQAAMEFLMTYGWAILVAIIAIGVLAYYGVFNPGRFVSDSVIVNEPFNAREAQILETGKVINIQLYNGASDRVNITSLAIAGCDANGDDVTDENAVIDAGQIKEVSIACDTAPGNAFVAGDSFKGDITITYDVTGQSYAKQSTGSIQGKVQA